MKTTTETKALLGAAENAVRTLREVAQGATYGAPYTAAVNASEALRQHARAGFMRPIEPIDADTTATLADLIGWLPTYGTFGSDLAALHGEALHTHPRLAQAIRGTAVVHRVRAVAEAHAARIQRPAGAFALEAVAAFERLIAGQMAEAEESARVYLVACDLLAEAHAIHARHQAHAADVLAASQREQRQADAAIAAAAKDRRDHLVAFFRSRHAIRFQVGGREFTGAAVAALLTGEQARDVDGHTGRDLNIAGAPRLDVIEKAMRQRLAFEAAA